MSFQSWNRAAVQAPLAFASRGTIKNNAAATIKHNFVFIRF
jgi:hypothetical protein